MIPEHRSSWFLLEPDFQYRENNAGWEQTSDRMNFSFFNRVALLYSSNSVFSGDLFQGESLFSSLVCSWNASFLNYRQDFCAIDDCFLIFLENHGGCISILTHNGRITSLKRSCFCQKCFSFSEIIISLTLQLSTFEEIKISLLRALLHHFYHILSTLNAIILFSLSTVTMYDQPFFYSFSVDRNYWLCHLPASNSRKQWFEFGNLPDFLLCKLELDVRSLSFEFFFSGEQFHRWRQLL